jgi:hypothetical protein
LNVRGRTPLASLAELGASRSLQYLEAEFACAGAGGTEDAGVAIAHCTALVERLACCSTLRSLNLYESSIPLDALHALAKCVTLETLLLAAPKESAAAEADAIHRLRAALPKLEQLWLLVPDWHGVPPAARELCAQQEPQSVCGGGSSDGNGRRSAQARVHFARRRAIDSDAEDL